MFHIVSLNGVDSGNAVTLLRLPSFQSEVWPAVPVVLWTGADWAAEAAEAVRLSHVGFLSSSPSEPRCPRCWFCFYFVSPVCGGAPTRVGSAVMIITVARSHLRHFGLLCRIALELGFFEVCLFDFLRRLGLKV